MKCINSGTENNNKERVANSHHCKACSHRFVFDPQTMTGKKFTDKFFAKLISDISVNNTFRFTEKQLFYLFNKRLVNNISGSCLSSSFSFIGFVLAFIGIIFTHYNSGLIAISIGILMLFTGTVLYTDEINKTIKTLLITPEKFQDYLNSWKAVNPIDGILTVTEQKNVPSSINSDITYYSFDRVVVCDNAEIANLLIANNFHLENNSAVLSIDGYPQNIFDTVMEMLRRNDNLKVYVLHSASPSGVSVVNTLSTNSDWFANNSNSNVTIYDLGLLPRQVFNNSSFFTQISEDSAREAQELPSDIKNDLTEKEIKWLEAGKYVELESFTPQRLLKVVSQGISKSRQTNIDNSSGLVDYGSPSSGDDFDSCDTTIFADDCFG